MERMQVKDWMTREPATVEATRPVRTALETMRERGVRRLPVLSGERLVGIITDRDVRTLSTMDGAASFEKKYHEYLLEHMLVSEAMTPEPRTITPGASLGEAVESLFEMKVGGLPVVEEGRLVGIITETDLLAALKDLVKRVESL